MSKASCNVKNAIEDCKFIIQLGTMQLTSPRSCAILIHLSIKKVISEIEIYPTNMNRSNARIISNEEYVPFLQDIGLHILLDESNSEMFVSLMILSPKPTGDLCEQKLTTRCIADLLSCISNVS
jgi:hypothetical protein